MALRRDVARCVLVVGILAVDSDLENSRLLLMKFGMPLGSEFRPARGHLELSSPRVGYFFQLTDTLKQQTNTAIGTLAVDRWVGKFETGSGWGLGARDTVLKS